MADDIPQWAKERVCALIDAIPGSNVYREVTVQDIDNDRRTIAFARYIAEHEEPPSGALGEVLRKAGVCRGQIAEINAEFAERGLKIVPSDA